MKIEARQIFRSNGQIDELVVYGKPEDYLHFADFVGKAITSKGPTLMLSESDISVQIVRDESESELFTSLQNEMNEYYSMDDWNNRTILKVIGSSSVLANLQAFLNDLSGRGDGYSYISEYSGTSSYSSNSPEWRLHVEFT
ncbi:MAG: hypothetical protein WAM60_11365 [Candidatus Promineifilaceae bacterium]